MKNYKQQIKEYKEEIEEKYVRAEAELSLIHISLKYYKKILQISCDGIGM